MSDVSINSGFVRTYKTNVELLLQQMGSRLRGKVMEDTYIGESAMAVEQVGAVEAQTRLTRHADTPLITTPHDSRWVFPVFKEWADLISDLDKIRRLTDPQSPYARNGAMALGRAMDREIIPAFFADAKTGLNGATTTAFDTANQTVATTVGGAGTGLNVAKLREAKRILMSNDVDIDNEEFWCAVTATQHDDLLAETQVTSLDFNTKPTLVDGRITQFMGFNFVHTELLEPTVADATIRRLPCWVKSGMHMGIWNDIVTRIEERADKGFDTQVFVKGCFGATRIEEGKVVDVQCQE